MPDITFLLKMDPKIGKSRIRDEEQDRLELEKLEFHQRVYEGYVEMEKAFNRIVGIDAARSIQEISADIIAQIEAVLQEDGRNRNDL